MSRTDNLREGQITFEKVKTLITALEIIAEGDPIGVGLDETKYVAQSALDYFDSED